MSKKNRTIEPTVVWKEFVLFWWIEEPGMRMSVYRTRRAEDIEVFSSSHYRIHFHPDSRADVMCEVILRRDEDTWWLKQDAEEECWCYYDEDAENGVWTWFDDGNQQMFVIRGIAEPNE